MSRFSKHQIIVLLLAGFLITGCTKDEVTFTGPPLKIGVMLPFSGPYSFGFEDPLDWAVENINRTGGVAGRKIELEKHDLATGDLLAITNALIADTAIKAVIGPATSSEVFKVAPLFIGGQKVFIAPDASAASLSRAFSGYDYFWRLTEPDISLEFHECVVKCLDRLQVEMVGGGVEHHHIGIPGHHTGNHATNFFSP